MKKFLLVLAVFLIAPLYKSKCQEIKKAIVDGLTLSYFLGRQDFEKLEDYLKENHYEFNPTANLDAVVSPGIKNFIKFNAERKEVTGLMIDTKKSDKSDGRIALFQVSMSGSFFIEKIRKEFSESSYVKLDSGIYYFVVPYTEKDERKKQTGNNFRYASAVTFGESSVFFYPPVMWDDLLPWENVFPKIFAE